MKRFLQMWLCVFILMPVAALGVDGWSFKEEADPLTDDVVTTAVLQTTGSGEAHAIVVRCSGTEFKVYVDFGEFLGNSIIAIRYRRDKEELVEGNWLPSANGTAVFAHNDADFARQLLSAKVFVIEATDFRGQPHRAIFDLMDASDVLPRLLKQCGLSTQGMEQQVDGLRKEIAIELEQWGPKNILLFKKVLTSLGAYRGPLDSSIEPDFAVAVQNTYDDYILKCREGKTNGENCESLRIQWKYKMHLVMPPISAVLYELAPKELHEEAGSLKMSD